MPSGYELGQFRTLCDLWRMRMSDQETLWSAMDAVSSDINTRLLPMLQLCKFASNAAQQLQDFRIHGEIYPEFKEGMKKATEAINTPLPEEAHELVAGVLYMAENLAFDIQERIEQAMRLDAGRFRAGVQG